MLDQPIIHIVEPPIITVVLPNDRPKIHVHYPDLPPEITLQERFGGLSFPVGDVLNVPKRTMAEGEHMSGVVIIPMEGGRGPTVRNGEALTTGMLLDLLTDKLAEAEFTPALRARLNAFTADIQANTSSISALSLSTTAGINAAAADAAAAQTDVDNLTTALGVTNGNVSNNTSDISALDGRVTTAEADIDAAEATLAGMVNVLSDISTLQSNATSLTTRVGVAEGKLVQHDSDIADLDAALAALSATANDASTKADNIELEAAGWQVSYDNQADQLSALEDNFAALEAAANKVTVRSISASDTAVIGEFLKVNCSAGHVTVTLPDPTDPLNLGFPIWIRKSDNSRYKVLTDVVNIAYQNTTIKLVCDGTDWVIS